MKRQVLFVVLLFIILPVYPLVIGLKHIFSYNATCHELEQLKRDMVVIEDNISKLNADIAKFQDKEYLVYYIREHFNYVKSDEEVFKIVR